MSQVINGTSGGDRILGTDAVEVINALQGADLVIAGGGNDTIKAGSGRDRVRAGEGDDTVIGGAGGDRLNGDAGSDTLLGGAGEDRLAGGADNDVLVGGTGSDTLNGGSGADVFGFKAEDFSTTEKDLIVDFVQGTDKLYIEGFSFSVSKITWVGKTAYFDLKGVGSGSYDLAIDFRSQTVFAEGDFTNTLAAIV